MAYVPSTVRSYCAGSEYVLHIADGAVCAGGDWSTRSVDTDWSACGSDVEEWVVPVWSVYVCGVGCSRVVGTMVVVIVPVMLGVLDSACVSLDVLPGLMADWHSSVGLCGCDRSDPCVSLDVCVCSVPSCEMSRFDVVHSCVCEFDVVHVLAS